MEQIDWMFVLDSICKLIAGSGVLAAVVKDNKLGVAAKVLNVLALNVGNAANDPEKQ